MERSGSTQTSSQSTKIFRTSRRRPTALKEPAERLETEQQATGHLVGSQRPDYVLIHCQNVAQAAIEWSFLIDCCAARGLVDELHDIDADPDHVRIGAGK